MRRPSVLERDVDAVIEKRFRSDPLFVERLVTFVFDVPAHRPEYLSASATPQFPHQGASGTIDFLIRLIGQEAEVGRILLENKLDSSFTPSQPERYASSAIAMARSKRPAIPVLCAPQAYIERSKYCGAFAKCISYEQLAQWMDGADKDLIEQAIRRFAMPYEPDPVPEVANFFKGYIELAHEMAPELYVKPNPNTREERPEHSRTIYFVVRKSLPSYDFLPTLRFSHQCWDSSAASPSVKVMFDGWAPYESAVRKAAAGELGNTRLYIRRAGRSLALVRDTPRMDNKLAVYRQRDAVIAGIRAAANIRAWMFANEAILKGWASAVRGA